MLLDVFISIPSWALMNATSLIWLIYLINYPQKTRMFSYLTKLNYDQYTSASEFRDTLLFYLFLTHKFQPTRARSSYKTLLENIFWNAVSNDIYLVMPFWLFQITYPNFPWPLTLRETGLNVTKKIFFPRLLFHRLRSDISHRQ